MKALTRLLLWMTAIGIAGCVHQTRFHAPVPPDGWSAQPLSIACRFAPDADLDPATGTPVGDERYCLYILIGTKDNETLRAWMHKPGTVRLETKESD